jgi:hypothetical protein
LADRIKVKQDGKMVWVDPDEGDARTNPMFSCEVLGKKGDEHRPVVNWMAFDPRYGPDTEAQIAWHIAHGTPGAETWEVGTPT